MTPDSWSGRRIAGYAGVAFGAIVIVGFVIGQQPVYDDSAADVRKFFVDDDVAIHTGTWLAGLGFVFLFLPFAAGLRSLLAEADDGDHEMWARLSYTGAVLATAISIVGLSFHEVLSQGTAEQLSDASLVALSRFDTVIFLALLPWAMGLFLTGAAVVIIRSGVLARWIGWLGAVGALLMAIGTLWVFGEDDESALALVAAIGLLIPFVWTLVVGVKLIRPGSDSARHLVGRDREVTA